MFLLDLLAQLTKRRNYLRLYRAQNKPEEIQRQILARILQQNSKTRIGREYHFSKIKNYESFKKYLPIQNADQYKERLQKVYGGESKELMAQAPHFFAMTAGSTGDYKYIPINKRFKKDLERSVYAFYYLIEKECPEFSDQPIQFLVGSAEGGKSPKGISQGFVSGFNYRNLPGFIRRKFIIPYWVFTLEDAQDRYYAMARYLADCPELVAIGAFSPINISNVAAIAIERIDSFIKDLESGTLTLSKSYAQTPSKVELKVNNALANTLAELKGDDSVLAPAKFQAFTKLVFPSLKYFATWMGGNMKFSLTHLDEYFGKKEIFEMPFSASEGIFGVPFRLNYIGGIAAVTSHFLEFIPEDEFNNENPRTLGAWQVEVGRYYYLVITTSGGLYRYNMEDLVLVKDTWGQIPVLEFISKKKRQISISNERINENDVTNAVVEALEQQSATVNEFVLVPTHAMHYKLLVDDFHGNLTQFVNNVEANLCKTAMGYDFEREDLLLKPLSCIEVKTGSLRDYVRGIQFRSDLPSAQFKPVHLANDFDLHLTFEAIQEIQAVETRKQNSATPQINISEEMI
ncbi:MAG: GH3 auxin-responsive promoter family protein [Pseudomonadales bacterium]|nr:GH3 auxin-responsive promoter family protein [Pseudomonadales bacterium]